MKCFLILALVFFTFINVYSQADIKVKKNRVYTELYGNGVFHTINYQRNFTGDSTDFDVRCGFGFKDKRILIPLEFIKCFNSKEVSFRYEISFGLTYSDYAKAITDSLNNKFHKAYIIYLTAKPLAVSYLNPNNHIFFRAGVSFMLEWLQLNKKYSQNFESRMFEIKQLPSFFPMFGCSFGYSF